MRLVYVVLLACCLFFVGCSQDSLEMHNVSYQDTALLIVEEPPGIIDRVEQTVFTKEQYSPFDRIHPEQIHVYEDRIVIDIKNAQWAKFTDTNSMDPTIDSGANAIQIVPESEDEIQLGDIVSYESEFADGVIIHRVVEIGEDEEGKYFIMKGDNNPFKDPGRVRFHQVRRVLVGIIY